MTVRQPRYSKNVVLALLPLIVNLIVISMFKEEERRKK